MKQANIVDNQKLTLLYQEGNRSFYVYHPTPFALLYHHFEKMTFKRRIRLLLEYFAKGKYRVFYLAIDGVLVGHCVVAYGNRRLKRSSKEDIVLGPYFVAPAHRGCGYAKDMIRLTLSRGGLTYRYAYDYIQKANVPSAKASLACGFEPCGELNVEGFFHRLIEKKNGEYTIYRYEPPKSVK